MKEAARWGESSLPLSARWTRRDVLRLVGTAAVAGVARPQTLLAGRPAGKPAKRVIVAGAGIGGLCCAYELMDRGHDVTVLEAAGRTGGHVRTLHDPLPDGLYADVGAEHFTKPGYEQYWKYVKKFNLLALFYPRRLKMLRRIDGKWYTEEQLHDPKVLQAFGLNQREIDFVVKHGLTDLPWFYFGRYSDAIGDEYQPFGVGLDRYDELTAGELLVKDGASDAALRFAGVQRGDGSQAARSHEVSALFQIWQTAISQRRHLPAFKRDVYRLRGGNQQMTDTFAARLGGRVRLGCPLTAIAYGDTAVTVHFREFGEPKKLEADYLVCSIPLQILRRIPVQPAWPEAKGYVLQNVVYGAQARVLLQSRTPFWKGELPSINLDTGDPDMYLVYQTADEVPGSRSILMGSGRPDVTADEALAAFKRFYPGKSPPIEQALVYNWAKDPWAFGCERHPFPLGQLKKFWPHILKPVGRIHFAGSFADNLPWGMDAATRSANRVADTIDRL